MLRKVRRSSITLAMTGLLAMGSATAAAASAAADPVPIGPNEFFSGLVNGSNGISSRDVIQTSCFGPLQPGQTGHPLPGQTVEVTPVKTPVSTGDVGYTGSAHSITAYLAWPYPYPFTATEVVATFSSYFVQEPIPVTLTVPCSGQGAVLFAPTPSSPTGRTATLPVTFVSQP